MRAFLEIVRLELRAFVRSKTLALLALAAVAWMFAVPHILRGDGTAAGAHELYVRLSLGGAFALVVIALLASATGSLARERTQKRLPLTLVRPVRPAAIALGKILAHVAIGALVLAIACAISVVREDTSRPCSHVLPPILPSPQAEAEQSYADYMNDPDTPEEMKKVKRATVLRLLENRARDRYDVIPTNATIRWQFDAARLGNALPSVRLRFTNQYEMRQSVRGVFALGDLAAGSVSNMTQAVISVPLVSKKAASVPSVSNTVSLSFANRGTSSLMLRPRKDLHLMTPADGFAANAFRAWFAMVAILAFLVSFGMFLSAGLGRPVALFAAFVMLTVSEVSPSVVDQYPDALETKTVDRIGLFITRIAAETARPISSLTPLESLARDECIEARDVLRLALVDLAAAPVLFSLLCAVVLPRKTEDS